MTIAQNNFSVSPTGIGAFTAVAMSLCAGGCASSTSMTSQQIAITKFRPAAHQIEFSESMRSMLEPIERCLLSDPYAAIDTSPAQDTTRVEKIRTMLRGDTRPNAECKPVWKGEIMLIRFMIKHGGKPYLTTLMNNDWHNTTIRYDYVHIDYMAHNGWYYHADKAVTDRYGICMQQAELKVIADMLAEPSSDMSVLAEMQMVDGKPISIGHAVARKTIDKVEWVLNNTSGMEYLFGRQAGKQVPRSITWAEAWTAAQISSKIETTLVHTNQIQGHKSTLSGANIAYSPLFKFGPHGIQLYTQPLSEIPHDAAHLQSKTLATETGNDKKLRVEVMDLHEAALSLGYVPIKEDPKPEEPKPNAWQPIITGANPG